MSARRRILLSAYVCRPGAGSEPAVGWEFLRAALRGHDVVLLTQARDEAAIRGALAAEGLPAPEIVAVSGLAALRRREGRLGLGHLDYVVWQWRAARAARRLRTRVDAAHHVTFGNDWLPAAVHFLGETPVLWGPVGGATPFPWRLVRFMSWRGLVREAARESITRAIRAGTARLVRRSRCTVIAANPDVAARFRRLGVGVIVEPHVALPPAPAVESRAARSESAKRIVFAARLMSWKGAYLALETLARLPGDWRLDVLGEGEERDGMLRRIERLGLSDRVRMLGVRPLEELRAALEQADALLFPSMHDAAPFVVGEAVRVGCPVVCLALGGPPALIERTGGIAVTPGPDTPGRLAEAVLAARRSVPSDRWSADRLPDLVAGWYDGVAR